MIQPFILATAGHVDHGKSALVKALTGTDPDRLPEEKARGITIDLGFAHLELPHPSQPTRFSCGVVDVPGHEDFVKNMVAGVGAVDVALLAVAADDGWMPQTEEHLQILLHLGVTRAVVALTKADLQPHLDPVVASVRARLDGTAFADAPIVPTSVVTHHGLEALRRTLAQTLAVTPPPSDHGKPRLAIDRVFVRPGLGTIVTGTLSGGSLARGDEVVLQPSGRTTRIRACQSHHQDLDHARPGTRVALQLADLAATDMRRGDVVTRPMLGAPSTTLDACVLRFLRAEVGAATPSRALTQGQPIRVHLGATQVRARLHLLDTRVLASGGQALAQLRLEEPVFAFAGDRFLLRDITGQATLAGGIILDPDGRRPQCRTPERLQDLQACARNPSSPRPFFEAATRRAGWVPIPGLLLRARFSAEHIAAALDQEIADQRLVRLGNGIAAPATWTDCLTAVARAVDQHHQSHPDQPGMPLTQLRGTLRQHLREDAALDAALPSLRRAGLLVEATHVRRPHHRPSLPPDLQAAGRRLRERLLAQPMDPPPRQELTPDAPSASALRFLIQHGDAVELGSEVVLAREAFERARRQVLLHLRKHVRATTSDLRQLLATTRRVGVPLLERLDREGLTLRDGDFRQLRPATAKGPPGQAPGTGVGEAPPPPPPCPPDSAPAAGGPPEAPGTRTGSGC